MWQDETMPTCMWNAPVCTGRVFDARYLGKLRAAESGTLKLLQHLQATGRRAAHTAPLVSLEDASATPCTVGHSARL